MTRIFVDYVPTLKTSLEVAGCVDRELIELDSNLSHHLRDVLRLDEGKQLSVVCRQSGLEYLAIIAAAAVENPLKIKIIRSVERSIAAPVVATLACGLPKGAHADQICEQVSQLGVQQILFWSADRSVAQPKQALIKLERWQKIAEASARQSKQNSIPKVLYLGSSADFYSWLGVNCNFAEDTIAVCSLVPNTQLITSIKAPQGRAHLIVGPEGDFSDLELKTLQELGATQISLGPLVLRVETAALVAVSMGLAAWGWR